MAPVKLKGISSSLVWFETLLLCGPLYLSLSILYPIGCWRVTLWVNISLSKRVVCSYSDMSVSTVKLLAGSRVYL